MIVRTVFSVLVVAGLLAGTALWNGPPREPQSEFAPIGELAREIAAKVEATVRQVKPVVEGLASIAEARHQREPVPVEPAVAPMPVAAPEESAVVALTDQDEWAGLIRRMLALYERVAPTR